MAARAVALREIGKCPSDTPARADVFLTLPEAGSSLPVVGARRRSESAPGRLARLEDGLLPTMRHIDKVALARI